MINSISMSDAFLSCMCMFWSGMRSSPKYMYSTKCSMESLKICSFWWSCLPSTFFTENTTPNANRASQWMNKIDGTYFSGRLIVHWYDKKPPGVLMVCFIMVEYTEQSDP